MKIPEQIVIVKLLLAQVYDNFPLVGRSLSSPTKFTLTESLPYTLNLKNIRPMRFDPTYSHRVR